MDRSTSLWIAIIGFSLLGATALYSCVPHIWEDLSAKALAAAGAEATPSGWASIQVDGQRLVLTGTPPDAQTAGMLIRKLEGIDGVIEVDDQLSTPLSTPLSTSRVLNDHEVNPDGDSAAGFDPDGAADSTTADLTPVVEQDASTKARSSDDVAQSLPPLPVPTEAEKSLPVVDPIIEAAEAGPGRPLLSEPLARCQRDIDALLTGSASFFTSASSEITAESLPIVDQVAALLAQCNARAEIAGHTDNSGRSRPNQQLSQARADAIRAHLVVRGVPEAQVSAIGFGEERPIVSNRTPEGRRQNRRIEVRIVDGQIPSQSAAPIGNRA